MMSPRREVSTVGDNKIVENCDPTGHLQECFLGNRRKCSGECFRSAFWGFPESALESAPRVPGKFGVPRECSQECFSLGKNEERHSREQPLGHSQFFGHSREHSPGHFLGILKSTPKALAGALSVIPQKHSCKWPVGSQFSTIKVAVSQFYRRGVPYEKQDFWTIASLPPMPPPPPPKKRKFYIYCRLAVSDWQAIVAHNLVVLQRGGGCRICVTVRLPVRTRGETMYWQASADTPFRYPHKNVPDDIGRT